MSKEPLVTEDVVARQPPEAQAISRLLLYRIAAQDRRIAALEAEIESLSETLRNSTLPRGTEQPHVKVTPQKNKCNRKPVDRMAKRTACVAPFLERRGKAVSPYGPPPPRDLRKLCLSPIGPMV